MKGTRAEGSEARQRLSRGPRSGALQDLEALGAETPEAAS